MANGRRSRAKKAVAARQATAKFARELDAADPSTVAPPARRREPLKLDTFKGKLFLVKKANGKVDEKKMAARQAVVLAAIEDGRNNAGLTESNDLAGHVFQVTGFLMKNGGRDVAAAVRAFVRSQCAEEDRSGRTRFYDGITDIVTAEDEELLNFVERDGAVVVVESCCGKTVQYGTASGLRRRCSIEFSVDQYGLAGATRLARLETYCTLGLIKKFEKQLKKLK